VLAKVRFAAMVGAAVFSAGVAVAAPLPAATAHADRAAPSSDAGDSSTGGTAHPGRKPAAVHAAPEPAAAARDAGDTSGIVDITDTVVAPTRPHRGSGAVAANTRDDSPPSIPPAAAPPSVSPAPDNPAAGTPAVVTPAAVAPAAVAPAPQPALTAAVAASSTPAPATPSAPRALAVMSATPGLSAKASSSATSSASLIDSLLAPIRTIFGEGTALLVRRTLFNQAPTVTPVQLTGQSEGPITGTLGAADPDGDPLTYAVTSNPQHGSAVVNSDGSYTFTPATGFAGNDGFVVAVTDTGFHINLLDLFRPASTSASVAVSQGALASKLRFQFVYGTGSQYWSSAARSALESAATQLSSYIVVTTPVTITYDVTGESSPFSATLASAGSDFINDGSGFLQTVVQSKIQTGNDANGAAADGTVEWNFGRAWALGSSVSNTEYDFQPIAMHELLHTFGFLSNIDKAGSNTGRIWTLYDGYVVNAAGAHAINGTDFAWNTAFNPNLTGGNSGLYFGGPHAVAANYGNVVPLYTPNRWESGSSVSHVSADTLMNANVSQGPRPRVLSPVELGMLADIGYTVNTGPGTPALLFVGLVTIGLRRRKD